MIWVFLSLLIREIVFSVSWLVGFLTSSGLTSTNSNSLIRSLGGSSIGKGAFPSEGSSTVGSEGWDGGSIAGWEDGEGWEAAKSVASIRCLSISGDNLNPLIAFSITSLRLAGGNSWILRNAICNAALTRSLCCCGIWLNTSNLKGSPCVGVSSDAFSSLSSSRSVITESEDSEGWTGWEGWGWAGTPFC